MALIKKVWQPPRSSGQLKDAPDDVRLEARFANTGRTASALLEHCRDDPGRLLLADDPKREPRAFVVGRSLPIGSKGGLGQGSFIGEARRQAADFYRDMVQDLSLPRPRAPKLPKEKESGAKAAAEQAAERQWPGETDTPHIEEQKFPRLS